MRGKTFARAAVTGAAGSLAVLLLGSSARAIDGIESNSRDYTPVPIGASLIATYSNAAWSGNLYANGKKADLGVDANARLGALRYVYSTTFLGMTINPEFIVPFYEADLEFTAQVPGVGRVPILTENKGFFGDLILGATIWFIENAATKSYAGFTPWVVLPTGEYSPRDHSISQLAAANRWQFLPQLGFVQGLTDKLYVEGNADVSVFGGNDDFPGAGPLIPAGRLDRDPLFTMRGILSYDITPSDIVALTVRHAWGGETRRGGATVNGEANDWRMTFQYQKWLTPKQQIAVEYLHDVKVENGLELDQVTLRTLSLF